MYKGPKPANQQKNSGSAAPVGSSRKKQNEDVLRKLAEEEEARKKAEEEERDRKRREAEQVARNKEIAKEEKKLRRIQMGELDAILDYNKSCADSVHSDRRQVAKWERYLRCDGTPNPTIPAEINTFVNILLEEPSSTVTDAFSTCKVLLALVEEIKFIINDTPSDQVSPETLEEYKLTLAKLQCLIQYKLDQATYDELVHASENVNPDSNNLERALCDEELMKLCIWGNLIKNPRIRSHDFPEMGFTFEIPKSIGNSSVAVRVLQTAFDHFSHMTKTFHPRKKVVEVPVTETPLAEVQEEEEVKPQTVPSSAKEEEEDVEPEQTNDVVRYSCRLF